MNNIKKYLTADNLFWTMLLVTVLPIWIFPHFLTSDGPCHIYNSGILAQFWWGDAAYYDKFYYVNAQADPNWTSHILLSVLSMVFSGSIADKLVITLCVLLFTTGFRYMVLSFGNGQKGMALWGLILVWQMAMFMGFYNYMMSMGMFFFIGGYWLRYYLTITWKQAAILSIISIGLFFSHLMGLFFLLFVLFMLFVLIVINPSTRHKGLSFEFKAIFSVLPALYLTIKYVMRNYTRTDNNAKEPFDTLWGKLRDIFTMQSITNDEIILAKCISIGIAILILVALFMIIIQKQGKLFWIIQVLFLMMIVLYYFRGYESLLGGSYISYRMETLVYVFGALFIASVKLPKVIHYAATITAVLLILGYTAFRLPAYKTISNIVSEYKSLDGMIVDSSVILPIKFELFPSDPNGVNIANRVLLFSHVAETTAPHKRLIYLENYEAAMGYFPLLWKPEVNPYSILAVGNAFGHEEVPPNIDIVKYNREAVPIDYIIIWGRKGDALNNPKIQELMTVINTHYQLVHSTPVHNIELYKLNVNSMIATDTTTAIPL